MSLLTPLKINSHQIALFGGLKYIERFDDEDIGYKELQNRIKTDSQFVGPSRDVFVLDVRQPCFYAAKR